MSKFPDLFNFCHKNLEKSPLLRKCVIDYKYIDL